MSALGFYGGAVTVKNIENGKATLVGPGITFDGHENPEGDTYGEYFSNDTEDPTYLGILKGNGVDGLFNHTFPVVYPDEVEPEVFYEAQKLARTILPPVRTYEDEDGKRLLTEIILDMNDEYMAWIAEIAGKGALGWSSGAVGHAVAINYRTGHIKQWIIGEFSLTPRPAEPRNMLTSYSISKMSKGRMHNIGEETYKSLKTLSLKRTSVPVDGLKGLEPIVKNEDDEISTEFEQAMLRRAVINMKHAVNQN